MRIDARYYVLMYKLSFFTLQIYSKKMLIFILEVGEENKRNLVTNM